MDDTPIDIAAARERLRAEQAKLQDLVEDLHSEANPDERDPVGEQSAADQRPADLGSELPEREKDLAILEGLELELAEVEAALARLDEGTYGIDEVTGAPIDPARLDAIPAARTNVDTRRE